MLARWTSVEKIRQIVREKEKRGINSDGKGKKQEYRVWSVAWSKKKIISKYEP